MTAELTTRQARIQNNANRFNFDTVIEKDGDITYLTVTNPRRPYAEKIAVGARINPRTGKENHFAMVDGKLTPLNRIFIVLQGMAD